MIGLAPCLFIENIILLGSIKLYLIGEDLRRIREFHQQR